MSETVQDKEKKPLKMKVKKPSLKQKESQTHKVDLNKKEESAVEEPSTEKVVLKSNDKIEEPKVELQEIEPQPAASKVSYRDM